MQLSQLVSNDCQLQNSHSFVIPQHNQTRTKAFFLVMHLQVVFLPKPLSPRSTRRKFLPIKPFFVKHSEKNIKIPINPTFSVSTLRNFLTNPFWEGTPRSFQMYLGSRHYIFMNIHHRKEDGP
jgi:hypothetical protein